MRSTLFEVLIIGLATMFVFADSVSAQKNLAFGKSTRQSSNFNNRDGRSSKAVDGNRSGYWPNGSITHTSDSGTRNPWWEVDLGAVYSIGEIKVWNRTDCCSERLNGFRVFTRSSENELWKGLANSNFVYSTRLKNNPIILDGRGQRGRYVKIQLEGEKAILSLAEVEVFEKKSVNSLSPDENQVLICQSPNMSGGCRKLEIGNYTQLSQILAGNVHSIMLGKNVKALLCSESSFLGNCKVYTVATGNIGPAGTRNVGSIRVLRLNDSIPVVERRPVPTPTVRPTPRPQPTPAATPKPAATPIPVILPDRNNNQLRSINFRLGGGQVLDIDNYYEEPANIDANYGSPAPRLPRQKPVYYFDFALNDSGELFYSRYTGNEGGFAANRAKSQQAIISAAPKLIKIGGSAYIWKNKLMNIYALNANGSFVRGEFDPSRTSITQQIIFNGFADNRRYSDLAMVSEYVWLLGRDSTVYSYQIRTGNWKTVARTNFIKIFDRFDLYGVTATNELFRMNKNGGNLVKVLDDVEDIVIDHNTPDYIYYISAKTKLLMKFNIGRKSSDIVDAKGTFKRFLSKNRCLVVNGNGQIFSCS